MRFLLRHSLSLLTALVILFSSQVVKAGPFAAYSLREAERQIRESGSATAEVIELGGISRLAGLVYDTAANDLIIVGQINNGERKITLNDFVVALRALAIHKEWPLVSIDKTPQTDKTGRQLVRFEGGIANTAFGRDLLEADVVLKKMALRLLPTDILGIKSYFALSAEHLREKGIEETVSSRFWFYPMSPSLAVRDGVFVIKQLKVGVRTQVMEVNGRSVSGQTEIRDSLGDEFAEILTANYPDISSHYPEVGRLRILFDLVALAQGIQSLSPSPDLRYWLSSYRVPIVETPKDYPLLSQREEIQMPDKGYNLVIEGGVELRALMLRLKDGDVSALRDAVLKFRPKGNALTWRIPLEGWRIPGAPEFDPREASNAGGDSRDTTAVQGKENIGAYVTRQFSALGASSPGYRTLSVTSQPPPLSTGLPKFDLTTRLPSQIYSPRVGGVMLRGAAKVSGAGEAKVDLAGGNFSLIVEGKSAQLAPETFRQFVTALWSVYYSKQAPGISIDPVAPEIKKHLVRYIGRVVNNDLGRVMREADYTMKKWVVGTEQPENLPGYEDVESLMAKYGLRYLNASRRFWFVPEEMRFRQAGDALLFDNGKMTLKTEYVLQNKTAKAEPADEKFAEFFTGHYQEIASKYPIYQELFDYAKMVSLATYLKENGVPLFWFMLANKDLVITEDSPGTVDELAKGSRYFKGVEIRGGVDLAFKGTYVYDKQAVEAINEALAKLPTGASSPTTLTSGKDTTKISSAPFSFETERKSYSVLPQHSLTSGKDRRGIRYQTDLALRQNGQPGLELVRYYKPDHRGEGEFGQGWHLLVPYRIKPADDEKRKFLNVTIPVRMAVENLVTGEKEHLTFSDDRYSIAGYVPDKLAASQVIGVFLMSDASYRLADKLGNEFWFDPAGYLTDMIFAEDHRVHFDYLSGFTDAFEQPPYRIQAVDEERVEFLNVRIPRRMKVTHLGSGGSEELVFSDKGRIAGYVSADEQRSRYRILALMSDASFRLADKEGNEMVFDPAGGFDKLAVAPNRRLIKSISLGSQGDQRVSFRYTIDRGGNIRIAGAHLSASAEDAKLTFAVNYQYDDQGMLYRVTAPARQVAKLNGAPSPTTTSESATQR